MSAMKRASPPVAVAVDPLHEALSLNVFPEGDSCVVHAGGELDLAGRNRLFEAATAGNHPLMVIDLAGVTFMDCSGHGSLVESRLALEEQGRMLQIRGATAQPARLLEMIAELESRDTAANVL
jgi:anti-anti-sigma factor